jgi:hypothetical protein
MHPLLKNGIRNLLSAKHSSLAAAKRLKKDIEAMRSHSSDPEDNDWNSIGKTPDEIAALCAEYEHGQKSEMAKRHGLGVEGKIPVFARTASCND